MQSHLSLLLTSLAATHGCIAIGCRTPNAEAEAFMPLAGNGRVAVRCPDQLNVMDTEASVELTFSPRSDSPPSIASYSMESMTLASFRTMNATINDKVDYTSAESEDGYGMATSVGVRVRGPGAEAIAHFDFEIEAVTVDDILKDARDEYNSWSKEEQSRIDKHHFKSKAGLNGLFKILPFSVGASGGKSHEDSETKQRYESTNKQDNLLRKIYDTTKQKLRIHGHVKAVGKSYLPIDAYAFVRVMHITYSNGEKQTIVESPSSGNAVVAADKNGDRSRLDTDPNGSQLNVMKSFV